MAVAGNGVVYVNTWSGLYYGNDKPLPGGFLIALKDTNGDGKADVINRFGQTKAQGSAGGTGIALYNGALYAEVNDRIVRYRLPGTGVAPTDPPETIVSGLPLTGDHPMHPFAINDKGEIFVDVATATNSCQKENRMPKSPGLKPCTELKTRGGIWRYDANKTGQKFSPAQRYATGIRNADGIAIDPQDQGLYASQHGRDELSENWPNLYKPKQGAELPAEELLRVEQGGDYGWPECYFDQTQNKLLLTPVATYRPSGVAAGPDGSLYISDDQKGRIWRVTFHGDVKTTGVTPASPPAATNETTGSIGGERKPPEGIHPNAGGEATPNLPAPPGQTKSQVALGQEIFHGQNGATGAGCHGTNAKGTPLGPDLTDKHWLWGDGTVPSIAQTITNGVPNPKNYRSPMPPMGGAQLTPTDVLALADYVWALNQAKD